MATARKTKQAAPQAAPLQPQNPLLQMLGDAVPHAADWGKTVDTNGTIERMHQRDLEFQSNTQKRWLTFLLICFVAIMAGVSFGTESVAGRITTIVGYLASVGFGFGFRAVIPRPKTLLSRFYVPVETRVDDIQDR